MTLLGQAAWNGASATRLARQETWIANRGHATGLNFLYLQVSIIFLAVLFGLPMPARAQTGLSQDATNSDLTSENGTINVIAGAIYKKRNRVAVRAYLRSLGAKESAIMPYYVSDEFFLGPGTLLFQAPLSQSPAPTHPEGRELEPDEESCGVQPRSPFELEGLLQQLNESGYFIQVYPANAAAGEMVAFGLPNGSKLFLDPKNPVPEEAYGRLKEVLRAFFSQYAVGGHFEVVPTPPRSFCYKFTVTGVTGLAIQEPGFYERYHVFVMLGGLLNTPGGVQVAVEIDGAYGSAPFGTVPLRYVPMSEYRHPEVEDTARDKLVESMNEQLQ